MPLRSLDGSLPVHINSFDTDVIEDLYKPCLRNSKSYYRGVGYFRSNVLQLMSDELIDFCLEGGKMWILTSTDMAEDDFDAAKEGYSKKSFYTTLEEMISDEILAKSTKILCALIQSGHLELKIAKVPRGHIYHDKVGFFEDEEGDVVAFHGSANETVPALVKGGNVESINVIWSWHECYHVHGKNWEDGLRRTFTQPTYNGFEILEIDSLEKEFVRKHKIPTEKEFRLVVKKKRGEAPTEEEGLGGPSPFNDLWDHQKDAIAAWEENGRFGIFEHATGSGKTWSALSIMKSHLTTSGDAIVLVHTKPLLKQWYKEISRWFPEAIIGRIGAGHDDYRYLGMMKKSDPEVRIILIGMIQSMVNPKKLKSLQRTLASEESRILLVVDECHRIGAEGKAPLCELKPESALGLSATPEVYGNPAGTNRILELFSGKDGSVVHKFTLKEALEKGILCPFYYHIKTVRLTKEEQKRYDGLREKMKWAGIKYKQTTLEEDYDKWFELVCQSRLIIRGASEKIQAMKSFIQEHYDEGHRWIVYCDTIKMVNKANREIRGLRMGIIPLLYHSKMDDFSKDQVLKAFARDGGVLIAIRCLDEGVNIESISHGIILSSTTNPREFIQRRGRLLRKHESKEFSRIFDAFALPSKKSAGSTGFVYNEVFRARELAEDSKNRITAMGKIDRIIREYDVQEDTSTEEEIEDHEEQ